MAGDQDFISPIMSNPENVYQLGPNAYAKPATALNILRETIMGKSAFDHAFKTYAKRWMFKHPTPEDFFRTMEDASAIDLDWFWNGWFYTTDYVDIGVKSVKKYVVSDQPSKAANDYLKERELTLEDLPEVLFMVEATEEAASGGDNPTAQSEILKNYLNENSADYADVELPKNIYAVEFDKPGGLVMPLIVEYSYADGTVERKTYPVQLWRKNDAAVTKVIATDKELVGVRVDPDGETADVNTENNSWPKEEATSDFEAFKEKLKG